MAIKIERITEVTALLTAAFARLAPQLYTAGNPSENIDLQAVVTSGNAALFAAEEQGEIVGVLTLAWYTVPSGCKAWIEDVVVDASQRGRGTGGALVECALAYAAAIGVEKVLLTSNPARLAAHALYLKTGFKKVETTVFTYTIT